MTDKYKEISDIAKRRGFFWPSFQIHGSASGFYDYGPLGSKLLNNIEIAWREFFKEKEGFFEVNSTNIMSKSVFEASGHLEGFEDASTQCHNCNKSFRADHLIEKYVDIEADTLSNEEIQEKINEKDINCPECGGSLEDVYNFNLMFKTNIGPGNGRSGYLRPETAQGIFVNFPFLYQSNRKELPFGVIQTGRAFRNEISPRKGVIRMREFQQMEAEVFVEPNKKIHPSFDEIKDTELSLFPIENQRNQEGCVSVTAKKAFEEDIVDNELLTYYLAITKKFFSQIGLDIEKTRFRQHLPEERAHYASDCWDAEGLSERFGWIELAGISDREDYDLKKHGEKTGKDLKAFREFEESKERSKQFIEPKMEKLGPKYRDKIQDIIEALKNQDAAELKKELKKNSFLIELDGEEYVIEEEDVEIKEKKEVIEGEKFYPHVIEPSYGLDRITYLTMEHSFKKDVVDEEERNLFLFSKKISPIDVGVFPLVKDEELIKKSKEVFNELNKDFEVIFDESGTIGRRYRRQDEIGTPFCVTIDYESIEDESVTIREIESTKQIRIKIEELKEELNNLFLGKKDFFDFT